MPLGKNKKTVALDFDGVVHAYSKGWHDGTAYDPPMPGAISAIERLMKEYSVYIFTTRNLDDVQEWFEKHTSIPTNIIDRDALYWNETGILGLANHKVVAFVWVDDRALRFTGDWSSTMQQLKGLLR